MCKGVVLLPKGLSEAGRSNLSDYKVRGTVSPVHAD